MYVVLVLNLSLPSDKTASCCCTGQKNQQTHFWLSVSTSWRLSWSSGNLIVTMIVQISRKLLHCATKYLQITISKAIKWCIKLRLKTVQCVFCTNSQSRQNMGAVYFFNVKLFIKCCYDSGFADGPLQRSSWFI